jgi:YTH domain-containing family protein
MLKIFKNTPLTSSVLEDFPFYETRQQAMLQEKFRRLGKVYYSSFYTPAVVVNTRSTMGPTDEIESASKDVHSDANDGMQSENLNEPKVQSDSEEKSDAKLEVNDVLKVGSVHIKVMESASEVIDMGNTGQK